jgi:Ca2+-binding EF-hand superfamily protein
VPGGARLVAVPLSAFMFPREGTNRLALDMDESRLAQLETFDATRWARINEPAYVAHIDRYFVQAFPVAGTAFFDRLDTNRDGFLSRAELSPLLAAGTDRYVVGGPDATMASFHAYDIDHDGFLDRTEASAVLPAGASFEHYDTNRDGFLSMAEAMPVLASVHAPRMAGLTFNQLDADHDGFVSRTEAERLVAVPGVATTRQAMVDVPAPSFDAYDVDRDGYLNRAEAASMLRHYGGTAAFDRYDANRDGFLSKAEVDALVSHNVGTSATEPGSGTLRGTR